MKKFLVVCFCPLVLFVSSFSMENAAPTPSLGMVYKSLQILENKALNGDSGCSLALYKFKLALQDDRAIPDGVENFLLVKYALLDAKTGKIPQQIRLWLTQKVEMA